MCKEYYEDGEYEDLKREQYESDCEAQAELDDIRDMKGRGKPLGRNNP